jgi:hypothetical protein
MKIPHPERGGNGESRRVVNQWLPWLSVNLRVAGLPDPKRCVALNHQSGSILDLPKEFF